MAKKKSVEENIIEAGDYNNVIVISGEKHTIKTGSGNDKITVKSGVANITAGGGNDTITTGSGSDKITVTSGTNTIKSGSGKDSVYGGSGVDKIYGGADNDYLKGNDGNDYLYGEAGADKLYGGNGNDIIVGGYDNDYLDGGAGNDTYQVGKKDGNDSIINSAGNDVLRFMDETSINNLSYAVSSNDLRVYYNKGKNYTTLKDYMKNYTKYGVTQIADSKNNKYTLSDKIKIVVKGNTSKANKLKGTNLNDSITGGDKNDTITSYNGNDTIKSGKGNDIITSSAGNDAIYGGYGNDKITVSSGNNTIYGDEAKASSKYDGNDTITTGTGNDSIYGGYGNDIINAGNGNNYVDGGYGNDNITTGTGNDKVYAGAGNDVITTGKGNDYINAGANTNTINFYSGDGVDTIVSGGGTDTIVLKNETQFETVFWDEVGNDLILHYNSSNDSIVLKDYVKNPTTHSAKYVQIGKQKLTIEEARKLSFNIITGEGVINGTDKRDSITGSNNSDTITANKGNDIIVGSKGNDSIISSSDSNVLVFNVGDGVDTIQNCNSNDTIKFDTSVDLKLSRNLDEETLVLTYSDDDKIILQDYYVNNSHSVKTVQNGNIKKSLSSIMSAGMTYIAGTTDATIDNGTGNDTLEFTTQKELTYKRQIGTNDLQISYDDATITLKDYFVNNTHSVQTIKNGDDILTPSIEIAKGMTYIAGIIDATINNGTGNDTLEFSTQKELIYKRELGTNNLLVSYNDAIITLKDYFVNNSHSVQTIVNNNVSSSLQTNLQTYGVVVDGTDSADTILGTIYNDTINSGKGNDSINASSGNNTINFTEGDGIDTIASGGGIDTIKFDKKYTLNFARTNNSLDIIYSVTDKIVLKDYNNTHSVKTIQNGDDIIDLTYVIFGTNGNDTITTADNSASSYIDGRNGNDTISCNTSGNNTIYGGDGDDSIEALYSTSTYIDCGNGDDSIKGSANGNNTIYGGKGNDSIEAYNRTSDFNYIDGGDDDDTIYGGHGDNIIYGGDGNDNIYAGNGFDEDGNDTIYGGNGNDQIYSFDGNDTTIYGGAGRDYINVSTGSNILYGGDDNDTIITGTGTDIIYGGDGNDSITSNSGNDTIIAGKGNDIINCGTSNVYIETNIGDGNDTIKFGTGNILINENIISNASGIYKENNDLIIRVYDVIEQVSTLVNKLTFKDYFLTNDNVYTNLNKLYVKVGESSVLFSEYIENHKKGLGIIIGDYNSSKNQNLIGSPFDDEFRIANTKNNTIVDNGGNDIYHNSISVYTEITDTNGNDTISTLENAHVIFNVNADNQILNDNYNIVNDTSYDIWKIDGDFDIDKGMKVNGFNSIETIETNKGYMTTTQLNTLRTDVASWLKTNSQIDVSTVMSSGTEEQKEALLAIFNDDKYWIQG